MNRTVTCGVLALALAACDDNPNAPAGPPGQRRSIRTPDRLSSRMMALSRVPMSRPR
jgi:hypothetical protein